MHLYNLRSYFANDHLTVCISDNSGNELFTGSLCDVPVQFGCYRVVPRSVVLADYKMALKIYYDDENEKCI